MAILARCLPQVKRILVLTPRVALASQLKDDIRWRFWRRLGFSVTENLTFEADAALAGKPIDSAAVVNLLPKDARSALDAAANVERIVFVGTFQALDQIRRGAESESAQASGGGEPNPDHGTNPSDGVNPEALRELMRFLASSDLVLVDEGHYEPAPSWSRAIREFNRPTILLSATPYRNDYKSFRVRGRFVYNLPFEEARDSRIIRSVTFSKPNARPGPAADDVTRFLHVLKQDVRRILREAQQYTATPKVIIRADACDKLLLLQNRIEAEFGERPVLIHENQSGFDDKKRRYQTVKQAIRGEVNKRAKFWLHETKLLEGIDEPDFVAIGLFEGFGNARQLVQQIGRVLRSTDPKRRKRQIAHVLAEPALLAKVESSWQRYLAFEDYCSEDPKHLVQNEAALPDRLLELLPKLQYIEGDFRPRYLDTGAPSGNDLRLPAAATVFQICDDRFDLERIAKEVEEALLAEDRFKPVRIAGLDSRGGVGFAYYGWRTSPYLTHQFFPEWTLGLCVLVRRGSLLFVNDTDGIAFEPNKLGLRRIGVNELLKSVPEDKNGRTVRVTRLSLFSLDTSDRAIRTMATRTHSFAETFTDLLDPVLVPTSVFGYIDRQGRYVSLLRSRISESYGDPLPLNMYLDWVDKISTELSTDQKMNGVFGRYALVRSNLSTTEAAARNILLDFDDTLSDFLQPDESERPRNLGDLEYDDLCADVNHDEFSIRVVDASYLCKIEFNERAQRYKLISAELDKAYPPKSRVPGKTGLTLTGQLNREQAFRIVTSASGVVYAKGRFFEMNTNRVAADGSIPLLSDVLAIPALGRVKSEKGEKFFKKAGKWRTESVFGILKAISDVARPTKAQGADWGLLRGDIRGFEILICDDDGEEVGDFMGIDTKKKRVALIHAKAAKGGADMSVTALQEVGRQVLASLAFCSSVARTARIKQNRWAGRVNANGKKLALNRMFRNQLRLTVPQIEALVERVLADRSWNREIWILGGRLMSRDTVEDAIRHNISNRAQQFLMYLESLVTTCARANSRLKIYCN